MSDPVFGFVIIGISVLLVWGVTRTFNRKKGKTLANKIGTDAARVIEEFRKKLNKGVFINTPGIKGAVDVYTITGLHYYEIALYYHILSSDTFSITREGSVSRAKKKIGFEDVLTGDAHFDEKIFISSSSPLLLSALLNSSVRKSILRLAGSSIDFLITDRRAQMSRDFFEQVKMSSLNKYATILGEIVKNFMRNINLMDRLIENILYDPEAAVRIRCIRLLAAHFGSVLSAREALRQCLDDEFSEVAIEAAIALGKEGMEHLAGLLVSPDNLRPHDRIRIIRSFGMERFQKGIPALVGLYSRVPVNECVEILKSLAVIGDDSCCDFLLDRLKTRDARFHSHVLKALESCGNVNSVRHLRIMASSTRGKMIRSEYDDVAERIAARLGKTEKGRLSLEESSPLDGALSREKTAGSGALSGEE